jgi:hypothetical protein
LYNKLSKTKVLACAVVILTLCLLLPVSVPSAKADFVIAWDYDSEKGSFDYDEYGQGFYMYHVMTNYTYPDWNMHPDYVQTFYFNASPYVYEWTVGYTIGIRVWVWMNSTLTEASDLTDGLNYMRLNATITAFGVELDSQTNLTAIYQSTFWDAEMWLYGFNAFFNVIAAEGATYTATITYEVYW